MPLATYPDVNPPYLVPTYDSTLIGRRDGGGLRFGIRLQGPGETAFFAF